MATTAQLPTQVSPPEFALSPALPHQIGGAEVWAFPVLPGDDGPLLGPGADEASEALGTDLLAALEVARATGRAGIDCRQRRMTSAILWLGACVAIWRSADSHAALRHRSTRRSSVHSRELAYEPHTSSIAPERRRRSTRR